LIAACAEAVEELRAARKTIASQGVLIDRQDELLKLEREISEKARSINSASEMQIAELNKALAAKDRVIAATEAEVAMLKKKHSFWSKAKWFLIGGAAGVLAGGVLLHR